MIFYIRVAIITKIKGNNINAANAIMDHLLPKLIVHPSAGFLLGGISRLSTLL